MNMMDLPGGLTPSLDDRRKPAFSGFGGRKDSDSEEDEPKPMTRVPGAAIAPPPSLQESFVSSPSSGPQQSSGVGMGMGVAAKIMAKYGFKVTMFVFWKTSIFIIKNIIFLFSVFISNFRYINCKLNLIIFFYFSIVLLIENSVTKLYKILIKFIL